MTDRDMDAWDAARYREQHISYSPFWKSKLSELRAKLEAQKGYPNLTDGITEAISEIDKTLNEDAG